MPPNPTELDLVRSLLGPGEERVLTTYSFWTNYKSCKRLVKWRYLDELVPKGWTGEPRFLGSLIHLALANYRRDLGKFGWLPEMVMSDTLEPLLRLPTLDDMLGDDDRWREEVRARVIAREMWNAYIETWADDDLRHRRRFPSVETAFSGPILNPKTGAESRTFVFGGKIDAIEDSGETNRDVLWESKTISKIEKNYLEGLWTQFQTMIYAHYFGKYVLSREIREVVYDILVKCPYRLEKGESTDAYDRRCAEAAAKNKSGVARLARREPESTDEYIARVRRWYTQDRRLNPATPSGSFRFHRESLYLDRIAVSELLEELWDLTQDFLRTRGAAAAYAEGRPPGSSGGWYQNTTFCSHFGRECDYWRLCAARGSELIKDTFYEHRAAHEELRSEAAHGDAEAAGAE